MREILYGDGAQQVTVNTRRAVGEEHEFAIVHNGAVIRTCDTWDQAARTRDNKSGAVILRLRREERKTMAETSYHTEMAIRRMASSLSSQVFKELRDHLMAQAIFSRNEGKSRVETEVMLLRSLLNIARSNRSAWSGGQCAVNLAEQERRDTVLSQGEDLVRGVLNEVFA